MSKSLYQIVTSLVKSCGTANPFDICKHKDIKVFYIALPIKGFYMCSKRIKMIFINSELSYEVQKFVCAHELGHAILHSDMNVEFLDACTYFVIKKLENEADKFASELLISDDNILDNIEMSVEQLSKIFNCDTQIIEYKIDSIKSRKVKSRKVKSDINPL